MKQLEIDFYNTINLNGAELKQAKINAKAQQNRIIEIFKSGNKLTPFDVWQIYESKYQPTPITSIRRAITNLTISKDLVKLDEMKAEQYGKPNHLWKINN